MVTNHYMAVERKAIVLKHQRRHSALLRMVCGWIQFATVKRGLIGSARRSPRDPDHRRDLMRTLNRPSCIERFRPGLPRLLVVVASWCGLALNGVAASGDPDPGFNPIFGVSDQPFIVVVQPDEMILLGGSVSSVN